MVDPPRARERSFCCGAGGGQMFLGEEKGKRVNVERAEELAATGAPVIGTACPFCQSMFRDALGRVAADAARQLLDIAQIAAACAAAGGAGSGSVTSASRDAIIWSWRGSSAPASGNPSRTGA